MNSLIITNGQVYQNGNFVKKDIFISDGKIIKLESKAAIHAEAKIMDAKGLFILPGGIDPHVHMHLPTPAGYSSDDFESGSRAALAGGTTSIIDFVTPGRGQSIIEALAQRRKEAENSLCDVHFHVSPVEWTKNTEKEIIHCIKNEGIHSFKVYMAYQSSIGLSDEDISKVMHVVGKHGGLITMHCEIDEAIEKRRNQFISEGKTAPKYHPLSRPNEVEANAVKKAIQLAKEAHCRLYIVHVSAKESLEHIKNARAEGQVVYAETCPHYLLLDDSVFTQDFDKASAFVMSPPLRKKADRDALWQALADGILQTVGTDHCPFMLAQKRLGISDFTKIPNGAGGVEHRMALLYTFGVLENKISLKKFIELTATHPAQLFGLKHKGNIAPGMDADLCFWDLKKKHTISAKSHHQNCDVNIYEGKEVAAQVRQVILRGEVKKEIAL